MLISNVVYGYTDKARQKPGLIMRLNLVPFELIL